MTSAHELRSGKGHRDENFPVASRLIPPQHRAPILAFYEFVRTADDVADHATLSADEKVALLDALERDHEFLLAGNVFTPDVIETWLALKRGRDIPAVNLRPHPYEFFLYYDA